MITDGEYVGELTPEEVIEQHEYRIWIHESWAGLVVEDPVRYPPATYGTYKYHMWAINGYEWGIKYIRKNNPVIYRCNLSEALATIGKVIINLFGRKSK